jgi:hypothetical protein
VSIAREITAPSTSATAMTAADNKPTSAKRGFWPVYFRESARPLVSLVFVLPLLLIYEVGVVALGSAAVRNGADALMRQVLDLLGLGQYFLLPTLTCAILLGWHHVRRERWRFSPGILPAMFAEAIAWAVLLLFLWKVLGLVEEKVFTQIVEPDGTQTRLARLVAFCGAGLYEELLFRLILLSAVAGGIRLAGVKPKFAVAAAIVVTSLAFSAAHYRPLIPGGDTFAWASFVFRFLAGAWFSVLFVRRGFGIAAGCHAFYDIIAQELHNFLY